MSVNRNRLFGDDVRSARRASWNANQVRASVGPGPAKGLVMHADSSARYIIEVPSDSILAFDLATDPGTWDQAGDGVSFYVSILTDEGMEQVFSTYIDPKQNEAERGWHPYTVDLSNYAGQTVSIVFETDGGPAGNLEFDWAGWGVPRLLRR